MHSSTWELLSHDIFDNFFFIEVFSLLSRTPMFLNLFILNLFKSSIVVSMILPSEITLLLWPSSKFFISLHHVLVLLFPLQHTELGWIWFFWPQREPCCKPFCLPQFLRTVWLGRATHHNTGWKISPLVLFFSFSQRALAWYENGSSVSQRGHFLLFDSVSSVIFFCFTVHIFLTLS